jgi:hypothetical protein
MNFKKLTIISALSISFILISGCKKDSTIKPCLHAWGTKQDIIQFLNEPCAISEKWDIKADE